MIRMSHPLHFFTDASAEYFKLGAIVSLTEKDSHHLRNVLRVRAGTEITLAFNKINQQARARITNLSNPLLEVEITELLTSTPNHCAVAHLICGLCKPQACEEIIEKASELGVRQISFFRAERSQYNDQQFLKLQDRLTRWQNIAETACKQSRQSCISKISIYRCLSEFLDGFDNSDADCFTLSLQPEAKSLKHFIPLKPSSVLCIGPEGDLTDSEYTLLHKNNFQPLSLGETVMRSETASIYGVIALKVGLALTLN